MGNKRSRRGALCAAVLTLGLTVGCATYNEQTAVMSGAWSAGNFKVAAQEISLKADKAGQSKDAVLLRLEQGAAWRAAGDFRKSIEAFDAAEALVNRFDEQAKVKVASETVAVLSNLSMLPYEGFAYDKIMMNTYKAADYLQLGEPEKARVELNRALERQREAVKLNSARLEQVQAQANATAKNPGYNQKDVENDPRVRQQMAEMNDRLGRLKHYADYVNPFTEYLQGIYFVAQAADASDLERARKALERVSQMVADNRYVREDFQMVNEGRVLPALTYVIFETGRGPSRIETRFDLPVGIYVGPEVPYIGAAFPKLAFHEDQLSPLTVTAGGTSYTTETVASLDGIVSQEFQNELPMVITKTLMATAVKAGAAYGVQEGLSKALGDSGKKLGALLSGLYQYAVNRADLRTWTTLPKEFQVCRFPTPPDRILKLAGPTGTPTATVQLAEGTVIVVWVKAVSATAPLAVSQFKLK